MRKQDGVVAPYAGPPNYKLGRAGAIVNLDARSAEQFMVLGRVSAFILFVSGSVTGVACMSMSSVS